MLWALKDGQRITPAPDSRAECPCCKTEVLSKCGNINQWHWAHLVLDCDPWNEPESEWHINWKKHFPDDWQEVAMGNHRADVKTKNFVIEFQASSISDYEIEEREEFYQKMIWVLRGEDFRKNLEFRRGNKKPKLWQKQSTPAPSEPPSDNYRSFRWKHPRKSWWYAQRQIVIDLGEYMFDVKKIYDNVPCGGWGFIVPKVEFLSRCGTPQEFIEKFIAAEKTKKAEEERRKKEILEGCAHENTVIIPSPKPPMNDLWCLDCGQIIG
jgi:hypothetical protein